MVHTLLEREYANDEDGFRLGRRITFASAADWRSNGEEPVAAFVFRQ